MIFLLKIWYYSKIDIKLIFLGILNWKNLLYSLYKFIFKVYGSAMPVIKGYLISHNLYKVNFNNFRKNLQIMPF